LTYTPSGVSPSIANSAVLSPPLEPNETVVTN
jgi:hypothetical protein